MFDLWEKQQSTLVQIAYLFFKLPLDQLTLTGTLDRCFLVHVAFLCALDPTK